jgi:hypothetical protein
MPVPVEAWGCLDYGWGEYMPASEHGDFENPKKSAYSVERYDSSWELAASCHRIVHILATPDRAQLRHKKCHRIVHTCVGSI